MNFKKLIMFSASVVIINANAVEPLRMGVSQSEKDKFFMTITSAHTRTFSKDNLIISDISSEDSDVWNGLMKEVAKYVKANSPGLYPEFEKMQTASDKLLEALKMAHDKTTLKKTDRPALSRESKVKSGLNIQNPDSAKKSSKSLDIKGIEKIIEPLKAQESILVEIQDKINKKTMKNDVDEILNRLALTLEVTITKVFKDFKKVEARAK